MRKRDLGIIISDDDLKFHAQVTSACKNDNIGISRIRSSFIPRNLVFLSNIYKLYVTPQLECCIEVWNPSYNDDIVGILYRI